MKRDRQTKIVATLGPVSTDPEMIRQLFLAGADVFRLNFSHGTAADHKQRLSIVRALEKEFAHPIGVMADLQGPKLRVGKIHGGSITLIPGKTVTFLLSPQGSTPEDIPLPHPEIYTSVSLGDTMLLDDGKMCLEAISVSATKIEARILVGGVLSNNKGVNIPYARLDISALTEKDLADLKHIAQMDVDFVALSFVQKSEDIAKLRRIIDADIKILAKIEKPLALQNLEEIVSLADGVMLARGDLGVELPPEEVPAIQKHVIQLCRNYVKPCIVATQMLETMVNSPVPTRAEASDVANAVYDSADAVMLSAESASGAYPVNAVSMMHRIIAHTEKSVFAQHGTMTQHLVSVATPTDAMTGAAYNIADTIDVKAIVTVTASGRTSSYASRRRPHQPIIGLTNCKATARFLTLVWGVYPHSAHNIKTIEKLIDVGKTLCRKHYAQSGGSIIIMGGRPLGTPGSTNFLYIETIG